MFLCRWTSVIFAEDVTNSPSCSAISFLFPLQLGGITTGSETATGLPWFPFPESEEEALPWVWET